MMLEEFGQEIFLSYNYKLFRLTFVPHNKICLLSTSSIPFMLVVSFTFSWKKEDLCKLKNKLLKIILCRGYFPLKKWGCHLTLTFLQLCQGKYLSSSEGDGDAVEAIV